MGAGGPLRAEDWELVRLHPYHTGRILARSPMLAALGQVASRHHERPDGSGYPAGVGASELDGAACLLAAADVLHALGEPRPTAPPSIRGTPRASCPGCRWTATPSGRCSPRPEHRQAALPPLPADLTERELEILRRLTAPDQPKSPRSW